MAAQLDRDKLFARSQLDEPPSQFNCDRAVAGPGR